MRVQRTRSSASPPHSPLTRHPLGSVRRQMGWLFFGFSLLTCGGCGSVSSADGNPAVTCELPEPGHAGSGVRVEAFDERGVRVPDISVTFSRPGEPSETYQEMGYGRAAWLKPGPWTATVAGSVFDSSSHVVEVDAERVCTLNVRLHLASACEGCGSRGAAVVRVTDPNGAPLPTVSIELGGTTATSDKAGVATFSGLEPGKYRVNVHLAGFDGKGAKVTVAAGRESVLLIEMHLTPMYER